METPKLGQTVSGFEVVGVKRILHGPYYPNTRIICELCVKGKRNAIYRGVLFTNGTVDILTKLGSTFSPFYGYSTYDGVNRQLIS